MNFQLLNSLTEKIDVHTLALNITLSIKYSNRTFFKLYKHILSILQEIQIEHNYLSSNPHKFIYTTVWHDTVEWQGLLILK